MNKCPYVFKSGKRKNQPCNKPCSFEYCKQHLKSLEKRKNTNHNVKCCEAITKSGNTITVYKNGVSIGTGTFTSIYSGNSPTVIGRLWDYTGISHQYRGYISNLRIVKGQALYSANFTPPTESFKG